jgi:hypothetical protein
MKELNRFKILEIMKKVISSALLMMFVAVNINATVLVKVQSCEDAAWDAAVIIYEITEDGFTAGAYLSWALDQCEGN